MDSSLPDIQSKADIALFVEQFYRSMLDDDQLADIFLDVAAVDLSVHQPLIVAYWDKLLFGAKEYRRHTMNIHRAVHQQRPFKTSDFERWLEHFRQTMNSLFNGPTAQRATNIAQTIANNMQQSLPS